MDTPNKILGATEIVALSQRCAMRRARDKDFAEQVTRRNMQPYYRALKIGWSSETFRADWQTQECYEILCDGRLVGVLRLSYEEQTYYVRDLQISLPFQGQGIGKEVLSFVAKRVRSIGCKRLGVCVFPANPAVVHYQRHGFQICKTEPSMLYMERVLE